MASSPSVKWEEGTHENLSKWIKWLATDHGANVGLAHWGGHKQQPGHGLGELRPWYLGEGAWKG